MLFNVLFNCKQVNSVQLFLAFFLLQLSTSAVSTQQIWLRSFELLQSSSGEIYNSFEFSLCFSAESCTHCIIKRLLPWKELHSTHSQHGVWQLNLPYLFGKEATWRETFMGYVALLALVNQVSVREPIKLILL